MSKVISIRERKNVEAYFSVAFVQKRFLRRKIHLISGNSSIMNYDRNADNAIRTDDSLDRTIDSIKKYTD